MRLPRTLGALVAASFATAVLTGTALATPSQEAPVSGDDRATAHDGNVTTCEQAGLPGTTILPSQVPYSITEDDTYVDVPDGTGITAIVVKGGSAYNVYLSPALGKFPWIGLHSPLNASGKPAEISHGFGCGTLPTTTETTTPTTETTTTTETTSTTTTTTTAGTTTTGSTTTTTPASSAATTTTTTTAALVAVSNPDDLASTGFGSPWLLGLGAALLAAGAGLLLVLRRRKTA